MHSSPPRAAPARPRPLLIPWSHPRRATAGWARRPEGGGTPHGSSPRRSAAQPHEVRPFPGSRWDLCQGRPPAGTGESMLERMRTTYLGHLCNRWEHPRARPPRAPPLKILFNLTLSMLATRSRNGSCLERSVRCLRVVSFQCRERKWLIKNALRESTNCMRASLRHVRSRSCQELQSNKHHKLPSKMKSGDSSQPNCSPGTQAREGVQRSQRISRPGSRPALTRVGGARPNCARGVEGPAF